MLCALSWWMCASASVTAWRTGIGAAVCDCERACAAVGVSTPGSSERAVRTPALGLKALLAGVGQRHDDFRSLGRRRYIGFRGGMGLVSGILPGGIASGGGAGRAYRWWELGVFVRLSTPM